MKLTGGNQVDNKMESIVYGVRVGQGAKNVRGYQVARGLRIHQEKDKKWTIDHASTGYMLSEFSTFERAKRVAIQMENLLDWQKIKACDYILECENLRNYLTRIRICAEEGRDFVEPSEELGYELMFIQNPKLQDRWGIFIEAWRNLNSLVGLYQVKNQIKELIAKEKGRMKSQGLVKERKPSMHMTFLGSPGTGKTEVGRIIGSLFYALGYLEENKCIEVARQNIVSSNIGGTEQNMNNIIQNAMGGVLFIDEAYALARSESSNDFGQEAIDVLIKEMEDNRDKFIVILAGYVNDMENLMNSNEGFRSRIRHHVNFQDYTPKELTEIAIKMIEATGCQWKAEVETVIEKVIKGKMKQGILEGNARGVRSLVEGVIDQLFIRIGKGFGNEQAVVISDDVYNSVNKIKNNDEKRGLDDIKNQAVKELEQLIGLKPLKKEIENMMMQIEIGKMREEQGLSTEKQRHHMVFAGPAGTGKTTVAKIIGKFFKGSGLLSSGHFRKVSRADLVAGYVGQTAKAVREQVNKAMGGILFIDEAYNLVNGDDDTFGKEAVAELIDLMEENKDDLVVILAGYEKEIEGLLSYNEGFPSRIAHNFLFPDYSKEDIVEITELHLKRGQFTLSNDAKETLMEVIYNFSNKNEEKFDGNGRWASKFVAKIQNAQNHRIFGMKGSGVKITKGTLTSVLPEDIVEASKDI